MSTFRAQGRARAAGPQERSAATHHLWVVIVLDTNIVAALMANGADLDAWLETVPRHELYTTVMTRGGNSLRPLTSPGR